MVLHVGDLTFALGYIFHHAAEVFFGDFDPDLFEGLAAFAVDFLIKHGRARDEDFEAFATHCLDKYGDLHGATCIDKEACAVIGVFYTDRNVGLCLTDKSFADLAGGHLLAIFTSKGAVVDGELHLNSGWVDFDERHGFRVLLCSECVADVDVVETCEADDITCNSFGHIIGITSS